MQCVMNPSVTSRGLPGWVKLGDTPPSLSTYLATSPPESTAHLIVDATAGRATGPNAIKHPR